MLTRLEMRNFKRFDQVEVPLADPVVLIGPNNSGKTTALQALALWEIGVRSWFAKHSDKNPGEEIPAKRSGATINRRDLLAAPVPSAELLWRDLHVRRRSGPKSTENIRIEIIVDGVTDDAEWSCGLEFDYANAESFYVRPIANLNENRRQIPAEAGLEKVAFLPPMSGLADREYLRQPGEIGVLIGQGRTAEILRNLCHSICQDGRNAGKWREIVHAVRTLFGVELSEPEYFPERGEITMQYLENNTKLDLSCSGRGLQQSLLLLAYLFANPGAVLLLDEPDAHLEILRQREIYRLLSDTAAKLRSQLIIASHSEVVLNEAADGGSVVAFVGRPHLLGSGERGGQVMKALKDIRWEDFYNAETKGWVLYLENATDLAVLQAFAEKLDHAEAREVLRRPFVHYVETNLPNKAREHFFGLKEAKDDLVGIALFDRLDKKIQSGGGLNETTWTRREIENYFTTEKVLMAYAKGAGSVDDILEFANSNNRVEIMKSCILEMSSAFKTMKKSSPWSEDIKASDDFLDPLFANYSEKLKIRLVLRKGEYHRLVRFMHKDDVPAEVSEKLDAIVVVAKAARPRTE